MGESFVRVLVSTLPEPDSRRHIARVVNGVDHLTSKPLPPLPPRKPVTPAKSALDDYTARIVRLVREGKTARAALDIVLEQDAS
jgi:hypothetical protein